MSSTSPVRLEKKFEVRQTASTGFGLFAIADYEPGEVILMLDDRDTETVKIMPMVQSYPEYFDRCYSYVPEFAFCVTPENPFWFLNHSCNPSAGYQNWGKIEENGVPLVAHRAIKAGEQITADYALFTTHDDGSVDGDPWEMGPCMCGQPNCRGTIYGYEASPLDIQLGAIFAEGPARGRVLAHVLEYLPDLVERLRREDPELYDSYVDALDNLKRRAAQLHQKFSARS
jgi:hypothetical protein